MNRPVGSASASTAPPLPSTPGVSTADASPAGARTAAVGRPPHDVLSPEGNLARFLQHQATLRPDAPALVFPGKTPGEPEDVVTFGELDRDGRRFAGALVARGLVPGDHVLLLVPPSRALYVAMVGVVAAGGVAVFVDPSMPRARLDAAIRAVKPRVFIGVPRAHLLRVVSPAARSIERRIVVREPGALSLLVPGERFDRVLSSVLEPLPIVDVPGDAACIVSFTSGTTGAPKGGVRTHRLLATQADALEREMPRKDDDVDLATLPLFALVAVSQGVPSVFAAIEAGDVSRFQPDVIVDQIRRHRVTSVGGSPAFLLRLARHVLAAGVRLPGVRLVTVGGAPAGPHLLKILVEAFPDAAVHVLYGSTEAEPVASGEAKELVGLAGRGCCVGRPHDGLEVRVVPAELGPGIPLDEIDDVALPVGALGEIVVAGPIVLERYIDAADTKATKLIDDAGRRWHRMGDLGRLDDEGRIWLHGRRGEVVARGPKLPGGALYPLEVEPAAEALDFVAKAGLVGLGPRAFLAVVPAPDVEVQIAVSAVEAVLAADGLSMVEVVPVADIPVDRRHRSRVDRDALREIVALARAKRRRQGKGDGPPASASSTSSTSAGPPGTPET